MLSESLTCTAGVGGFVSSTSGLSQSTILAQSYLTSVFEWELVLVMNILIGLHQMKTHRQMAALIPEERFAILASFIFFLASQNATGWDQCFHLQADGAPLGLQVSRLIRLGFNQPLCNEHSRHARIND